MGTEKKKSFSLPSKGLEAFRSSTVPSLGLEVSGVAGPSVASAHEVVTMDVDGGAGREVVSQGKMLPVLGLEEGVVEASGLGKSTVGGLEVNPSLKASGFVRHSLKLMTTCSLVAPGLGMFGGRFVCGSISRVRGGVQDII